MCATWDSGMYEDDGGVGGVSEAGDGGADLGWPCGSAAGHRDGGVERYGREEPGIARRR